MAKMDRFAVLQPRELTAILPAGHVRKLRENKKMEKNPKCRMPSPRMTSVCIMKKREAGRRSSSCKSSRTTTPTGTRNARSSSRGHRRIAHSPRGYTPSDVPPDAAVYTYKHFYTDTLAVLD